MNIKNVTVFGSGVLGSQIAFQTAYKGFNVTVYDLKEEYLNAAKEKFEQLGERYKNDLQSTSQDIENAMNNISFSADLAEAVKDADLGIEAVPEDIHIKKDFYTNLAKVAPEKTIFATNSSTLLPSQFAEETGRPERFLALHFANEVWKNNTAEIMKHSGTDQTVFETIIDFAKAIGMVALPIYKEQPGYILNSLLVPFLGAAMDLYVKEIADPQTIDKTWMIATGAPKGPFAIYDIVGLTTAYNITKMRADASGDERLSKAAWKLKRDFIDKGKLGVTTGEGFYKYSNDNEDVA
ncbi:MAG: 3-hydroxyacyl-CoA dehydrogenase [Spirochaetales bacterium]|nr:3-hydroxyacyl-CoA dehydrogenase [Spirochaetales bacterium]